MHVRSHILRVARAQRLLLYLAVHGCTAASGGAVELSWKLRPDSGATNNPDIPGFLDCSIEDLTGVQITGTQPVPYIRLEWQVGAKQGHSDFVCDTGHGVTNFDLLPGIAMLSVVPLCARDLPALVTTYAAPAPEQRSVIAGDAISLGAVELIVDVTSCTPVHCICQ
jgi:hypothetical protein